MLKRLIYIWMILLSATLQVAGQGYVIDEVCQGAQRTYRVEGENGSTWVWSLKDDTGAEVDLSIASIADFSDTNSDGDPIYGSEISIPWSFNTGNYDLSVEQTSSFGCVQHELGTIEIVPAAEANAGSASIICKDATILLSEATASNYSDLLWTTDGDGTFDDSRILNATYTPGENDITAGVVNLTLTANGLLSNGTCNPAASSVAITITDIQLSTASTDVSCFNETNGSATVTATGGVLPYTYLWNDTNAQTTETATNLAAGEYQVTVTDANGCSETATVTIDQPSSALSLTSSQTNIDCFGDNSGSATITATGGVPPYSYLWDDPNAQTTETASDLFAGNYQVIVEDSNGCAENLTVSISEPAAGIELNATTTNASCAGYSDGSATVTAINGVAPYTYLWDDGSAQTTQTATNLAAGTYTVLVTDAVGCPMSKTVTIDEPVGMTASVSGTDISCHGANDGTATVTATDGTPPYLYLWDDTNAQTTATADNLAPGTYRVIVTDANSCTTEETITINEPDELAASVTQTDIACFGAANGSATVNVTGGVPPYSYEWDDPAAQTTETAINLPAGTYTVLVKDVNDCNLTATATITEPASALTLTTSTTDITCYGESTGSATVTASGGIAPYRYEWDDPNTQTSATASNLPAGTYLVKVTDANSCEQTANVTINQPASGITAVVSHTDVTCSGQSNGTATVTVSNGIPPYSYQWDDPAAQTSETATNLPVGNYTVVITDASACTSSQTVSIGIVDPIVISETHTESGCNGATNGSITLTITGGTAPYTYLWDDGETTKDRTSLATGDYSATVTDANGCSESIIVNVPESTDFNLTETHTSPTCDGSVEGTIDLTVSGGTAPFTFSWSNGETTEDIGNLGGGTYSVNVTDANLCVQNLEVTIDEPNTLILTTTNGNVACKGASTGWINLTVSGGTQPYSYNWSNGATSQNLTDITAGTYTVIVTDDLGCSKPTTVTVSEPALDDTESPVVTAPDTLFVSCDGVADAPYTTYAEFVNAGGTVSDNMGFDSTSFDYTEGSPRVENGQTIIERTYSIEDNCGNVGFDVQVIVTRDDTNPTVVCNSISISLDSNGTYQLTQADIETIANGSSDNCTPAEDLTLAFSITQFDCEMVGTTVTGTLTVIDASGNEASCETTVIVTDDTPPEITCQDVTVYLDDTGTANLPITDAILNIDDNCEIDTFFVDQDEFDCSETGTNAITLTAIDIHGLQATCNFTATVLDTIRPTLTCNNYTISLDASESFQLDASMVSGNYRDNCAVDTVILSKNEFTCADIGDTPVTVTIIDANNNQSTCTAVVTVVLDNEAPVANDDDGFVTVSGAPIILPVLNNDTDDQAIDASSLQVLVAPAHGSVTINSNQEFVYTSDPTFAGTDEFTYTVCDEGIPCYPLCDHAKVTIEVLPPNNAPVANVDKYETGCYPINEFLLENDYDPDGDDIIINTNPVEDTRLGNLTLYDNGDFRYEFERGISGLDWFIYEICDNNYFPKCDTAIVYLYIFTDFDCDNVPDSIDIDDDNDGILDVTEDSMSPDFDGDGVPNSLDIDSDNDGIPDNVEAQEEGNHINPSGYDENGNGLDDAYETDSFGIDPTDTDGDGAPDYLDEDADNDGVPDNIEGYDIAAKGVAEITPSGYDDDGDGLDDAFDHYFGGYNENDLDHPYGSEPSLQDFDGDGIRDWRDVDDDGDDIPTREEDLNNNGAYYDDDLDFDGHPEYLDFRGDCEMFIPEGFSPDGDGIHDYFQIYCMETYTNAKLMIFDRYGNMLYEKDHYGNREYWGSYEDSWWNGETTRNHMNAAHKVDPEVYMYILDKGNGKLERGFVMVSY